MNTDAIIIEQFILEHGKEAARALENFEPEKLAAFFNETSDELLKEVIPLMNPQLMSAVFESMHQDKVVQLFEALEIHYTVLSIRMMNEDLAEKILNTLSSEKSILISRLRKYPENSVGSLMDTTVSTLSDGLTVKEALAEVQRYKEKISPNLFVLTSNRRLAGVINLSDLISEDPQNEIKRIMNNTVITFPPETPVQSILNHQEWTDYYTLPVVDQTSVFLGVIRLETIRSILINTGKKKEDPDQAAIRALGELYQIGLAGLLKSATDIKSGPSKE
jgi:magnesium transporter